MNSDLSRRLGLYAARLRHQGIDRATVEIFDVVTILQEAAERLGDDVGIEVRTMQADERLRPVDCFGNAGHLRETPAPDRQHETSDLARELFADARRLELKNPYLLLEAWMIDEEIQASSAECVADFPTPVGRKDHVRDVLGADRSKLRYRDLKVRQDFEQECLETIVGTVDLVDQQDGRALAPRDRAKQRTLEQVLAAENQCLDFGCTAPVVLGKPGAQHLTRVIPFVERRVDVEPFVALQANELGAGKPRHHFRELRFPT